MVYPCDKVLDQADVDKINQYIQNNKLYKFTQFYPNLYKRDLPKNPPRIGDFPTKVQLFPNWHTFFHQSTDLYNKVQNCTTWDRFNPTRTNVYN